MMCNAHKLTAKYVQQLSKYFIRTNSGSQKAVKLLYSLKAFTTELNPKLLSIFCGKFKLICV